MKIEPRIEGGLACCRLDCESSTKNEWGYGCSHDAHNLCAQWYKSELHKMRIKADEAATLLSTECDDCRSGIESEQLAAEIKELKKEVERLRKGSK